MSVLNGLFGLGAGRCENCASSSIEGYSERLICHRSEALDPGVLTKAGQGADFVRRWACKGRYFTAKPTTGE